jgi:hypothetical protein
MLCVLLGRKPLTITAYSLRVLANEKSYREHGSLLQSIFISRDCLRIAGEKHE